MLGVMNFFYYKLVNSCLVVTEKKKKKKKETLSIRAKTDKSKRAYNHD